MADVHWAAACSRRGAAGVVVLALGLPAPVRADTPTPSIEMMKAAAVVLTHDALAADCRERGGPAPEAAAKTAEWEATNRVQRVRVQLAELMSDPTRRAQLQGASRSVVDAVRSRSIDPCAAAQSLTRTNEAQFGARVPELAGQSVPDALSGPRPADVAGAPAGGARPRTVPGAASAPLTASPAPTAGTARAVLAQVEGFAFDTRGALGYGGLVTIDVHPVVLLRDGRLLTDVTGLAHPAGLDAHRREHPEDWTRWRRAGGELQRQGRDGWQKIAYQKVRSQLPSDLRLNGSYRRLGGSGTLGAGGSDAVAVWSEYAFTPDGRVVRTGGAGARSEAGDVSAVTRSAAPRRAGSYRVDGLQLRIDYDDGTSEAPVLVMDPDDPRSALWLDGVGYSRRRN